jgi:hypothetical protein
MVRQLSDDGMGWPFSWSPPGRGFGGEEPWGELSAAVRQFTAAVARIAAESEHAEQAQQHEQHDEDHDDPDEVAHGHGWPP